MGGAVALVIDAVLALVKAIIYAYFFAFAVLIGAPVLVMVATMASVWSEEDREQLFSMPIFQGIAGLVMIAGFFFVLVSSFHERRLNRKGIRTEEQLKLAKERRQRGEDPEPRWWDWLRL